VPCKTPNPPRSGVTLPGMGKQLVTDELCGKLSSRWCPRSPQKPEGGRPRIPDREPLSPASSSSPQERHPLGDAPPRDGLRLGLHLLATPQGPGRGGGVWEKPHRVLSDRLLGQADEIDRERASLERGERTPRQRGGEKTAKNPTDRGKPGYKRHLVSDRKGVPLAVVLTSANVHDSDVFEGPVDAIGPIKRPGRGRPRERPAKLHAHTRVTTPRSAGRPSGSAPSRAA
jgi:hypothetical protein